MGLINKSKQNKLREAFAVSYREREKIEGGDRWMAGVLDRVRSVERADPEPSFLDFFQKVVWRLAPVACGLLFLLGAAISQFDLSTEDELVRIFAEDTAEFSLIAANLQMRNP